MKRLMLLIFSALALFFLLGIATFYWVNQYWLPQQVAYLRTVYPAITLTSPPQVGCFPLRLICSSLSWHGSVGYLSGSISVEKGEIVPNLTALFRGEDRYLQINLHGVQADLKNASEFVELGEAFASLDIPSEIIESITVTSSSWHLRTDTSILTCENWYVQLLNPAVRQEMRLTGAGKILLSGDTPILAGELRVALPLRYYPPNITFQQATATFTPSQGLLPPGNVQITADGAINLTKKLLRLSPAHIVGSSLQGDFIGEIDQDKAQGQFRVALGTSAAFNLDGALQITDHELRMSNASLNYRGIHARGAGSANFADPAKLAAIVLNWADGTVNINLRWDGKNFILDTKGLNVLLGDVLDQLGIPGLEGCPAKFDAQLQFGGVTAEAIRRSVRGYGSLTCRGLTLEPFGQLAMLLPLLGRNQKFPDMVDNVHLDFTARDGLVTFSRISAQGRGLSLQGSGQVNLPENSVEGKMEGNVLDLHIPLRFHGPLDNVALRLDTK